VRRDALEEPRPATRPRLRAAAPAGGQQALDAGWDRAIAKAGVKPRK
jgi:hypothetical protein